MVLFNTASFISLVFLGMTFLSVPSFAQNKVAARAKRPAPSSYFHRFGVGVVSLPHEVSLSSSQGNKTEVAAVSSGFHIGYDLEKRSGRWVLYGSAGVSILGLRASSDDSNLQYSFADTNYLNYSLGAGAYYLTERSVRVGLGVKSFYDSYELPVPKNPGVTYQFDYKSDLKNYATLDLQWQFLPNMLVSQSLMQPLTNSATTAWLLSLKFRVR